MSTAGAALGGQGARRSLRHKPNQLIERAAGTLRTTGFIDKGLTNGKQLAWVDFANEWKIRLAVRKVRDPGEHLREHDVRRQRQLQLELE